MSTMEQVRENILIASEAEAGSLSALELDLVACVTDAYKQMLKIDCTGCAYCMPCPNGVNIPFNFSLYNDFFMFKDLELASMAYQRFMAPEQQAADCAECDECEEHCPQQLEIRELLKEVDARLSE